MVTRRALFLFAAVGVIWGTPYFFIKIALEELAPHELVFLRCALAGILMIPLAIKRGAFRSALPQLRWVLLFAVLEMAGPWWLVAHAEERISSGFAGLFIATVPLIGLFVAYVMGDHHAFAGRRIMGVVLGLAGVTALVGLDTFGGHVDALSVSQLFLVAIGYAVAPAMASVKLAKVDSIGTITISLLTVAIIYAPFAIPSLLDGPAPSANAVGAIVGLGLLCSVIAFILFFQLIDAVGPSRATVVTFINPAVAVLLGALILSEPLTTGTLVGFPLVLLGSWLATHTPKANELAGTPTDVETTEVPRPRDGQAATDSRPAPLAAEGAPASSEK